nr:CFF_HP1_G0025410.mRNA.1.CDS.1 [Saccharomyces cerevisiae]
MSYSFLGIRSDEIKHLFLYGIDIYFCPEGVFTQYGLCKGRVKRCSSSVSVGLARKYRIGGWLGKALAVERIAAK